MANALSKINARVKQLKKKHPNMPHVEAQRKASAQLKREGSIGKPKKKAAVGKRHKKAAPKRRAGSTTTNTTNRSAKKIKVKLKPGKKGTSTITIGKAHKKRSAGGGLLKSLGISGISINKVQQELRHQQALTTAKVKHQDMLKDKALRPAEKSQIRRDIKHYTNSINASKKHVSVLKRSI